MCCCVQTAPYLTLKENFTGLSGNDLYDGYCADLAKKIADNVGFDYLIKPVADGKYGGRQDNGSWNGMVGELVRRVRPVVWGACIMQ